MTDSNLYEVLGAQYDAMISWKKRLHNDLPLICGFLDQIPARIILDGACGTGEFSLALAARGFRVIGIDTSIAMIRTARRKLHHLNEKSSDSPLNVSFMNDSIADMEKIASMAMDAVVILGNSLAYLHTHDALMTHFRAVKRILKPGGGYLAQLRHYSGVPEETILIKGQDSHGTRYDRIHETLDGNFYRMRIVKVSGDSEKDLGSDLLRNWSVAELLKSISDVRPQTSEVWGSLSRTPFFDGQSKDIVLWLRF
ncbi:class I SAM-dependent methyltransferase [bacterium]|nr:class I SAM-dependent methyltransferase [candidate division CSSED10-310 bacterium]